MSWIHEAFIAFGFRFPESHFDISGEEYDIVDFEFYGDDEDAIVVNEEDDSHYLILKSTRRWGRIEYLPELTEDQIELVKEAAADAGYEDPDQVVGWYVIHHIS